MKHFTSFLTLGALLLFPFFVFAQAIDKAVVLKTPTGNIKGSLLSPKSDSKIPVILFIVGSGPTDRNGNNPMMSNNSLKLLAEGLAQKGIATLRYDKRGIAESKDAIDSMTNLRFDHWVADAKSWAQWLENEDAFSSITILGHSQGSLVGMLAAQNGKADKFISLAGAGEPIHVVIDRQLMKQSPMFGLMAKPLLDSLANGELVHNVPPILTSLLNKDLQPFLISWMKYDPVKEIKKLKIPILTLQGNTDIQVTLTDADLLNEANTISTLVVIDQMNHVLKKVSADQQENYETYSNPDLPIHEKLVEEIARFVKR